MNDRTSLAIVGCICGSCIAISIVLRDGITGYTIASGLGMAILGLAGYSHGLKK